MREWVRASLASLLVTTPLLATSFRSDQIWWSYRLFSETDGNIWSILVRSVNQIGGFLAAGNFRPAGRLLVDFEHALSFDTALATGIPPHVIQGFVRLGIIMVLAIAATRLVAAVCQPFYQGETSETTRYLYKKNSSHLIVLMFPMVLAASLFVSGREHPLLFFPLWSVVSVVVVLLVPLIIASDDAITTRWSWRNGSSLGQGFRAQIGQLAACAILGAALAMVYELVYIAPVFCGAMVAVRGTLGRRSLRALFSSVAAVRLAAFTLGMLAVVVPVRVVIGLRCATEFCIGRYGSSNIALSGLSPEIVADRILAGLPWAGKTRVQEEISSSDLSWISFLSNVFVLLIVCLLVVVAWATYRRSVRVLSQISKSDSPEHWYKPDT